MENKFKKMFEKMVEGALQFKDNEPFTDSAQLRKVTIPTPLVNNTGVMQSDKRMVAIIGNRFMNGGWISKEELKKCYKQWNGTLHDINHMGTSTGFFLVQSDITYFIGYHSNAKFDDTTGEVSMDLTIHNKTKFAEDWQAYVELCEMAGRTPNVSVTYYGEQKWLSTSEVPKECNWKAAGYSKDDLIPILINIKPVCISTVLEGRCNDKDGCGLGKGECDCEITDTKDKELEEQIEKKRQELIEQLKKEDNK